MDSLKINIYNQIQFKGLFIMLFVGAQKWFILYNNFHTNVSEKLAASNCLISFNIGKLQDWTFSLLIPSLVYNTCLDYNKNWWIFYENYSYKISRVPGIYITVVTVQVT